MLRKLLVTDENTATVILRLVLGVVFLMTVKPETVGSVSAIVVGAAAGVVAGAAISNRGRGTETSGSRRQDRVA